jgi:hypothetical protein
MSMLINGDVIYNLVTLSPPWLLLFQNTGSQIVTELFI